MKRYRNIKRGSVIVEAAIFLPVFLIGVLTLGLLIRQSGTEETVLHAMLNQGRFAGVTAYSALQTGGGEEIYGTAAGLGSRQLFQTGVQSQLNREISLEKEEVSLTSFHYLYDDGKRDHLIGANVRYTVKVPLPTSVIENMKGEKQILLRAFVGATKSMESSSAEELQTEKESHPVWIFPKAGERYHKHNCSFVASLPVKCILTMKMKARYDGCSLCRSDNLGSGSLVYCYTGYGQVYHRGNCRTLEKYVVKMEKEKAVQQGYLPCQKCGG